MSRGTTQRASTILTKALEALFVGIAAYGTAQLIGIFIVDPWYERRRLLRRNALLKAELAKYPAPPKSDKSDKSDKSVFPEQGPGVIDVYVGPAPAHGFDHLQAFIEHERSRGALS